MFSFLNLLISPNIRLFLIALTIRLVTLLLIGLFTPHPFNKLATYYDSDSYLAITQSFPLPYNSPSMIHDVRHYPLLPFFIFLTNLLFRSLVFSGHFVVIVASSMACVVFYNIAKKYSDNAYELAMLFSCFPPKWLHVSTFIFSEPVFMVFLLFGILLLSRERYLLGFASLGVAGIGRPVGVLFVAVFAVFALIKTKKISVMIKCVSIGATPFVLFHVYLYSVFHRVLLLAHSKGYGDKIFSFPFDGLLTGLFDANMMFARKLYTPSIFIFYFLSFLVCLAVLRKDRYLLIALWYLPYFLFTCFVKGNTINWWFISSPRLLLPVAPAGIILLGQYVSRRTLQILFCLAVVAGIAYSMGSCYFL